MSCLFFCPCDKNFLQEWPRMWNLIPLKNCIKVFMRLENIFRCKHFCEKCKMHSHMRKSCFEILSLLTDMKYELRIIDSLYSKNCNFAISKQTSIKNMFPVKKLVSVMRAHITLAFNIFPWMRFITDNKKALALKVAWTFANTISI